LLASWRIGPRLAALIILATGSILLVVTAVDYTSARRLLEGELRERAKRIAQSCAQSIHVVQRSVENVVQELALSLSACGFEESQVYQLLEQTLHAHGSLFGSAVVMRPGDDGKIRIPYVYRDGQTLGRKELASSGYAYETLDWYRVPRDTRKPVWTEPYFDEGGGDRIMVTYSAPILGADGSRIDGIVTGDLELNWLTDLLASLELPAKGYPFLISRRGTLISYPERELVLKESISSAAKRFGRPDLLEIEARMMRQEEGVIEAPGLLHPDRVWLAYAPVKGSDWSLGLVFPRSKITADLAALGRTRLALGVLGVLVMAAIALAISRSITRPIRELDAAASLLAGGDLEAPLPSPRGRDRDECATLTRSFSAMRDSLRRHIDELRHTTEAKAKIEMELQTARKIQLDLLPSRFQFEPSRPEVDLCATVHPAREVGGDFFDFFFCGADRLFVAVADVSGKGVPAAIFMAVSKTFLKSFASQDGRPSTALAHLNDELVVENDESMFLTVFCATIDLCTGECEYSSGGHPPPFILRHSGAVESPAILQGGLIGLEPGQRFESGTFRLEPGDLLLCTSDGVLEAQNTREELYDEERARVALAAQTGKSAAATIEGILDDVARFTSGADPSDDITVLALKYLGAEARRQPTAPGGSKAAGPSEAGGGPRPPRGSR